MLGFKHKNASKEEPRYVVVYRGVGTPGFEEIATRDQAMAAFTGCLHTVEPGGSYAITPHSGRRVYVTGPDYRGQIDDPTDPLLVGEAAVRAVLTPAEYTALVQARVAAALLES